MPPRGETRVSVQSSYFLSPDIGSSYVRKNGKHGIQLLPSPEEIFLLLFADDIVLVSSTPSGLQNQINNLEKSFQLFRADCESGQNEGDDL